jgi:hypothetical protein
MVFVGLSVAVATLFFVVSALLITSLDLVTRIGEYPIPMGPFALANHLNLIHFPLSFGVIVFGPWVCCVLVSVCSHPMNAPQNARWFIVGAIASIMVAMIWIQWTTFISVYFLTMPGLLVEVSFISNTIFFLLVSNFVLLVFIILVSLLIWFRWLTW